MTKLALALTTLLLVPTIASAQQQPNITRTSIPPRQAEAPDYERWHVELTGQYWPFKPTGDVKMQSFPGNMRNDLGIEGWKSHPAAGAVVQLTRKNKLVI